MADGSPTMRLAVWSHCAGGRVSAEWNVNLSRIAALSGRAARHVDLRRVYDARGRLQSSSVINYLSVDGARVLAETLAKNAEIRAVSVLPSPFHLKAFQDQNDSTLVKVMRSLDEEAAVSFLSTLDRLGSGIVVFWRGVLLRNGLEFAAEATNDDGERTDTAFSGIATNLPADDPDSTAAYQLSCGLEEQEVLREDLGAAREMIRQLRSQLAECNHQLVLAQQRADEADAVAQEAVTALKAELERRLKRREARHSARNTETTDE